MSIRGDEMLAAGRSTIDLEVSADGGHTATESVPIQTQQAFARPKYPAVLTVADVTFSEPSGNNALDGYESGEISFRLVNM